VRLAFVALVMLASACGRIEFSPLGSGADAAVDGSGTQGDAGDSSLVIHYSFDGVSLLQDDTGRSSAICTQCPTRGAHAGHGDAAVFDGIDDCIRVMSTAEPANLTFAAWFLPSADQTATVFGKPESSDTTFDNTFEIFGTASGDYYVATLPNSVNGSSPAGEWHHLAGTFDGTTLRAYYDGGPVGSTSGDPLVYTPEEIRIGCDRDMAVELGFWSGSIDDVRLYSRALTPSEIAALAQ